MTQRLTSLLGKAEIGIYTLIAFFLLIAALVILGYAAIDFCRDLINGTVMRGIIMLLEQLLLAFMCVELLYSVMVSIDTRRLSAEPFLLVGVVAAIRRILTLSVEMAHIIETQPHVFKMTLVEIGVLTATILILVVSIVILRKFKVQPQEKPG